MMIYGVLRITGGEITQNNDSRYAVYNANEATISGGTIKATGETGTAVGTEKFSGDANKGVLTISGGAFESPGNVIQGSGGAEITITKGDFSTTSSNNGYIVYLAGDSTAVISGGTYSGINDTDKIVNVEESFAMDMLHIKMQMEIYPLKLLTKLQKLLLSIKMD